jgi:hypothetical protein
MVLESANSLSHLPRLQSIHLWLAYNPGARSKSELLSGLPTEALVVEIGKLLRLKIVYTTIELFPQTGRTNLLYWKCVLREGRWCGQVVPDFTGWDIQHNRV